MSLDILYGGSVFLASRMTPRQIRLEEAFWEKMETNPDEIAAQGINYREIILDKLDHLLTFGITVREFEDFLIVLLVLRFIIYSIRYNPITSFKMCCIGAFSTYLWLGLLNKWAREYTGFMPNNNFMLNMYDEQVREYLAERSNAIDQGLEDSIAMELGDYPFWSLLRFEKIFIDLYEQSIIPLFENIKNLIPQSLVDIIRPYYEMLNANVFPYFRRFWREEKSQFFDQFAYIFIVRSQKKFCPYHVRWHYTYVIIHDFIFGILHVILFRAQLYVNEVLIPLERYDEVETYSIYIGVYIWMHLGYLMLAALHALFSQYFFVPLLTEAVEMQIGPRPKKSIWSGGYTAWQDQPPFYRRKFSFLGDSTRLWWGWLGRGVEKRPPKKKRKRRGKGKGKGRGKKKK